MERDSRADADDYEGDQQEDERPDDDIGVSPSSGNTGDGGSGNEYGCDQNADD